MQTLSTYTQFVDLPGIFRFLAPKLDEWTELHKPLDCQMCAANRRNDRQKVGFKVLTAARTNMEACLVIAPCSLLEVYRGFKGLCCLHRQGPYTSQQRKYF